MHLEEAKPILIFNKKLKTNSLYKIYSSTLVALPTPSNLSIFWNFGSLLALCLIIQIVSGLLLATTYRASLDFSFTLTTKIMELIDSAWYLRYTHANGASLFFVCIYLHIGRGLYFNSFLMTHTWIIGVTILLLTIAAAFLGYVLPVNQISFWGASVITNLFTEIPYIGPTLVKFLWGGVYIDTPTITRFFTFHFIIPFVILALVLIHITFLHTTGSSNPVGVNSNTDKVIFQYNFIINDVCGVLILVSLFTLICLYFPLSLGDNDNFVMADPSTTPHHIQPEWYFLFAYAILRSIPNKLGGVIALAFSVLIFYFIPLNFIGQNKAIGFYPLNKILYWIFIFNVVLLTWIGARSVEVPYILTGQILTITYFSYFILNPLIIRGWDKMQ